MGWQWNLDHADQCSASIPDAQEGARASLSLLASLISTWLCGDYLTVDKGDLWRNVVKHVECSAFYISLMIAWLKFSWWVNQILAGFTTLVNEGLFKRYKEIELLLISLSLCCLITTTAVLTNPKYTKSSAKQSQSIQRKISGQTNGIMMTCAVAHFPAAQMSNAHDVFERYSVSLNQQGAFIINISYKQRQLVLDDMALWSSTDACYCLYCTTTPLRLWLNWSDAWGLQMLSGWLWVEHECRNHRRFKKQSFLFIWQRGINSKDASQMHAPDTEFGEADILSMAKVVKAHVWCQSDFKGSGFKHVCVFFPSSSVMNR